MTTTHTFGVLKSSSSKRRKYETKLKRYKRKNEKPFKEYVKRDTNGSCKILKSVSKLGKQAKYNSNDPREAQRSASQGDQSYEAGRPVEGAHKDENLEILSVIEDCRKMGIDLNLLSPYHDKTEIQTPSCQAKEPWSNTFCAWANGWMQQEKDSQSSSDGWITPQERIDQHEDSWVWTGGLFNGNRKVYKRWKWISQEEEEAPLYIL
ncbi:hypothetical protein ACLMJK_005101 [Lecanora helva]